jgi:GNAT superfamily N-acetyltransferase
MTSVIHLYRPLFSRPVLPELAGIGLRTFALPTDIAPWLSLRHRAFAREKLGVRAWDEADFRREFCDHVWWRPEWHWLAESRTSAGGTSPGRPLDSLSRPLVGSVALAERRGAARSVAVIHWLAVDPSWRGQGVGRLLLAALEQAAWDSGRREVHLETHVAWTAAMRFYQAAGYREVERAKPLT